MQNKETAFLSIESPMHSQNVLSPRFDDMIPIYPNENVAEQQMDEALKLKRNIFERKNFRALNDGHKSHSSNEDGSLSSFNDNSGDDVSPKSRTHSFIQQYMSPSVGPNEQQNNTPNQKAQSGLMLESTNNFHYQVGKSNSKLEKYQSFVQQFEIQEDKLQRMKTRQAQKKVKAKEIHPKRMSGRREGTIGLNYIWSQKGLMIIRLVSRFIQQLKTKTETIKFRLLTQKIFSVIGDLSSNFEFILVSRQIKQKPSLFLILKYNFQKQATKYLHYLEYCQDFLSRNIIVIKPDSKFKIIWDILLLLFIVMNIFYIPINISFNITTSGAFEYLFDLLPSWIFVAEIILNFNTAYYDKGLMHEDRKSIVKHYLKENFFWDLIVVIPFLISNLNIPFVRYTLLLRLTRLNPLMESIEEMLNLEENIQIVVDLFKLIFFLVLTGHFCGCAWHFVALTEHESFGVYETWLTHYDPAAYEYHWFDRYIISLYWSVITTVTVGYGDIVPVTTFERVFVIVVTLLLCGIFGYCISNIGNIFKSISDKKTTYKFKLRQIHQHIRKRGLNLNLSLKVKKYFEYYFKLEQEEDNHADIFLSQLTKHLREEVLTDLYSNTLKKSRLLRDNFNEITINNLCQFVKEKKVLPEEALYSRYDQPKKIWFVLSGALEYVADHKNENDYYEATETFLKKVSAGAVLGEREFITQQPYEYKVRAVKFTQMAYIDYDDFINVIAENDREYEIFCMKRDRLLLYPAFKGSGNVCEICEWTHNFIQQEPYHQIQVSIRFFATKYKQNCQQIYFSQIQQSDQVSLSQSQEIKSQGNLKQNLGMCFANNCWKSDRIYTDEYLISLGFQLSPIQDDISSKDHDSSQINCDSKSISNSEKQNAILSKNLKVTAGITTDLRESRDLDLGKQIRKSVINFKRIQFGKERTRAIQFLKKENQNQEKIPEALEQSLMLSIPTNQLQNNLFMKPIQQKSRRTSNLDDLGFVQVSQKLGNLAQQLNQQDLENHIQSIKQVSKNSEESEIKDSINIKRQIESQERKVQMGDQRRKVKKTTIQMGQRPKRRSYQNQQTSNQSPVSQNQQQVQQITISLDQKKTRASFIENRRNLGQTAQLTSSGLIELKGEVKEGSQVDSLQQKILDIVHTNINLEMDICKSTLVYFPEYNIDSILKKIEIYYQLNKGKEKKLYKRTKSNRNLFERIKASKNATIKSLQMNSKSQTDVQKQDENT
ncbi:unnamed protein product (macronuclear) [Paramecium tetraurelia]|uniref:Cyclic nucleotide-binding domain-containing protein n=1 Tax=Paramecium tetraurelia TaxID=5888 RepID=A0DXC3_PARTE|nr:uncharacterized protein GSPATT00021323001 [Paramecium tetraurelia]CAK87690.1 unnamed protein product [Paramecium tetraurelia]|eukprot:XP_001455087.1 hypothetical protein (macronuclear) [Paramecium tetraurelia strain d4-2]